MSPFFLFQLYFRGFTFFVFLFKVFLLVFLFFYMFYLLSVTVPRVRACFFIVVYSGMPPTVLPTKIVPTLLIPTLPTKVFNHLQEECGPLC